MIAIQIEIPGLEAMQNAMRKAKDEVIQRVKDEILKSTIAVHKATVERIQNGPATGTVYELYKPNRTHQASKEGEAPMSDSGTLASDYKWVMDGLIGYVYSKLPYSKDLELGTKKMGARPHLLPSLEEEGPKLAAKLKEILK